jgi:hypothetical protein
MNILVISIERIDTGGLFSFKVHVFKKHTSPSKLGMVQTTDFSLSFYLLDTLKLKLNKREKPHEQTVSNCNRVKFWLVGDIGCPNAH